DREVGVGVGTDGDTQRGAPACLDLDGLRLGDQTQQLVVMLAELAATGGAIPASWHQTVEDVAMISLGEHHDELLRLVAEPQA
ncbi:hypothetical protein C6A85_15235, partial [Mycobacterium sp. ITM-2017-0098]